MSKLKQTPCRNILKGAIKDIDNKPRVPNKGISGKSGQKLKQPKTNQQERQKKI